MPRLNTRPHKRRRGLRLSLRGILAILLLLVTALSWPLIQTRASLFSTPSPAFGVEVRSRGQSPCGFNAQPNPCQSRPRRTRANLHIPTG